jgi:transposase
VSVALRLQLRSVCEKTNINQFINIQKFPCKPPHNFVSLKMQHKQGTARDQISFNSFEDRISRDNPVRFIDVFSGKLDLEKIGFSVKTLQKEGRPSFESSLFVRLYLYGYLNGLRSSRKLEKECERNIELHWLLHGMTPNYHSISDFRKDNPQALKKLFKLFVIFLKNADLISGETIAIDGTKSRAHNSKKANFSQKKIDRHMEYIDQKVEEYMSFLSSADVQDDQMKVTKVLDKIASLNERKIDYELLEKRLQESGEPQISTTDPDSRALLVQGQVVEVSYNIQAAVDDKHNLVVATHTINRNDRNALAAIAKEVQENLEIENYTALVDKGYHNGRQIQECTEANITTIVASPELVNSNEKGTTKAYMVTEFIYNKEADTYTCPQGETLTTTGTWHKKTRERDNYQFKKYRTPKCKECPVKSLCTARASGGREIDRSEYAEAVTANNLRYQANAALYRKRQEINEHIFGTIKRQWGYNHTNLNGLEKVGGEHALILLVYNIKRAMNILGVPDLIEKLKNFMHPYMKEACFVFFWVNFKPVSALSFFQRKIVV